MVTINEPIPDIAFKAYQPDMDKEVPMTLADFKGTWLILFFYPADFTFICPTELQDMAAHYDALKQLGAVVVSVSTDTVFVHKAWHDASPAIKTIRFPMAADPTGVLCKTFGTYIEEGGDAGLSLRGTFIIDPDGVLKAYEMHDTSIGRSAAELVRKVQAATFVREHGGEVCPANWRPGDKTLKPGLNLVGKI